ncbi:MAG: hypothetical protein PHW60_07810 [Kiritimatiellae bacterium]|nr:hypothetical protein [Kiritimatiellia bacterium]
MKTGSSATGTSTRFDAMTPAAIQQVPLDRVTQTIYARIYAAMAPLREEMERVQDSAAILMGTFAKFRESLPVLDATAYVAMREQLSVVSQSLQMALKVPLSMPTRNLAAQLVLHDLPRLAAIAVKLNEEEAPKFFAAINYTDSKFETFAVDAKQKTTIRKADLETAIQNIVSKRVADLERLVKEDTAKWFAAKGIVGDTLSVVSGPRYALRRDRAAWKLVYDGQEAVLRHERGILYVAYLLQNPPREPIHALDLAVHVPDIYRKQLGITATTDALTGETVQLHRHARIQERSLGIEALESAKGVWKAQQKWEAVLEDNNATEPERAEALRYLEEIATFQRKYAEHSKSNADRLVRAVRRAVTRFHDNLVKALDANGNPHPVLTAFAEHLNNHLLIPSARYSGSYRSRSRTGIAGCFTYEPPAGVTWAS